MIRRLFLAAMAASVSMALLGCGTVSTPKVQAQLSGKSITVVSLVGETVQLSWRGATVFNNEFGEARVPDWGLRTRIEDKAVATLEASGRFSTVKRAQVSATRREDAMKQISDLNTGSSHVLLISPNVSGDSIFETAVGFAGLGVAQRSMMRLLPKSAAHASLKADLVALGTFDNVIAQSVSANAQRVPAPALLIGPRLNPDTTGAVRDALQVQVDAVVQSLLTQMGLDQPIASVAGQAPVALTPGQLPLPNKETPSTAQTSAVPDAGVQAGGALAPLSPVQ
ncbi:hypothetical protein [Hydrogenophaga sp. PAMC20947]|uniref:hypothetical protein n=1 Tax=Hydrogenophaga sp. PAMC20947 TaxID=2565558 RepID=UPI00109D9FF9|nr:hypothetical protein [Hydrogenophaga sp. PAMC20947]QCB47057.1 hypothetical protein E5678_14110 [Hydrogenophaga sp. PAMC20947]